MSLTNDREMDDSLHNQSNITVKKTFFGLRETIFYNPTKSKIDGGDLELDPNDGDKIKELLELPDDSICETVAKMEPLPSVENGMYDLSYCYSQDHKFAALQLAKYMSFEYRPVTAIRFVENETAESLLRILLK
ncbi:MAG: hypothetical protein MJZ25_16305 [Fibrobacter sp.]|nr:hypothetical protein [Fibrobacter sp.]